MNGMTNTRKEGSGPVSVYKISEVLGPSHSPPPPPPKNLQPIFRSGKIEFESANWTPHPLKIYFLANRASLGRPGLNLVGVGLAPSAPPPHSPKGVA